MYSLNYSLLNDNLACMEESNKYLSIACLGIQNRCTAAVAVANKGLPRRWRQQGPAKHWYRLTSLLDATTQKTLTSVFIAMRTSNVASVRHSTAFQQWNWLPSWSYLTGTLATTCQLFWIRFLHGFTLHNRVWRGDTTWRFTYSSASLEEVTHAMQWRSFHSGALM